MAYLVLDKAGRTVFPKSLREQFDTNVFEVTATKKEIVLKPRENLASLFGKFPEIDVEGFRKERNKEIARERFA